VIIWGFQILNHKAFNSLSDLFLIKKDKGITNNLIKKYLTARELVYRFMDDWVY